MRSKGTRSEIALVALTLVLGACTAQQRAAGKIPVSMEEQYEEAIRKAAVRKADWNIPLWPLNDAATVSMSTFTQYNNLDTGNYYIWVSPTAQLSSMCKGKMDPVLALQQILGLPPNQSPRPGNQWRVFIFDVASSNVFRPCPGGVDPNAQPDKPRCVAGDALDPKMNPEITYFMLKQSWSAHHASTVRDGLTDFGYPWTGMGWTYDWDPLSKTNVGVSEFIVQRGTVLTNVRPVTPSEFCAKQPSSAAAVSH
jgi:hypothetical protein